MPKQAPLNEQQRIRKLLALKTAPQGAVSTDLPVALYVVAALYGFEFEGLYNLGVCARLLAKVGFTGNVRECTFDDFLPILERLVSDGALVPIPGFKIFAAPGTLKIARMSVRLKPVEGAPAAEEKSFGFYVLGEDGTEMRLKSRIVLLPQDEVDACYVTGGQFAYAVRLTRKRACVCGRIMMVGSASRRYAALMPSEPGLQTYAFDFPDERALGEARSGDVVIAEITERGTQIEVRTREVVKDLGALNNIVAMAVLRNGIPSAWPETMAAALTRVPDTVRPEDRRGREDLCQLPLVTIDGEDARDFDDAVYCRPEGRGWRLYVAIADVSFYVRPGTLLDREAQVRCNSCYFPNYVIPMLPEKLSNGICSLNPDVERLCMVCELEINAQGQTTGSRFYPAVMRSHARLTYTEAWQMIETGKARFSEHQDCVPWVKDLYALFGVLDRARVKRGALAVETPELAFAFNEDLEITGISPVERNDAHKLIEECMIAANVAAAAFVASRRAATLYRVHARPPERKLDMLRPQLAMLGLDLAHADAPRPQDYARLLAQVKGTDKESLVGEILLRSMAKAEYSPENGGHFGLALEQYAHFTSPIRRYPDLQLHREIKHLLEKDAPREWGRIGARAYTKAELLALGFRCNERETAADQAEHEVDFELACVYLSGSIGDTFDGTVTAVTRFGLFVRLEAVQVDGMLYIGNLGSDYYTFDEQTQRLVGGGRTYQAGQRLKVMLAAVNGPEHKIDLLLPDENGRRRLVRDAKKPPRAPKRAAAAKAERGALLGRLSDISRAQPAAETDTVMRSLPAEKLGQDLLAAVHYTRPLQMPARSEAYAAGGGRATRRSGKNKR